MLVVEDEPNIRELVCLHLGLEGYACEGVGDGQDALERAEAERFDLLVLDVMIPGLDGLSLCRAVRNGRMNHDVPILMLTARREESDKVRRPRERRRRLPDQAVRRARAGRPGARAAAAAAAGRGHRAGRRRRARTARSAVRSASTASRSIPRAAACGSRAATSS